ncbi:Hypothetical_protein [Hexamita inflata]|uniref:Hypothetical_protein n=1 Tax=Hexamita inflata TaxID=28002 RepID=A0AA86RQE7_9EUKA|nr:Hypothetical protein HINF_LOCUS58375 [Hexamita inflata]
MLRLFCGSQTYEMNSFISSDKKTVQMATLFILPSIKHHHSCFSSKIIAHLGQISNQVLWISIPVSTSWSLISCLVVTRSIRRLNLLSSTIQNERPFSTIRFNKS